MVLTRRVALNGSQLDDMGGEIVIRSINPGVSHEQISATDKGGLYGQRITGAHWQTHDVTVTFAIDIPKKQMKDRQEVFDHVMAWAMQGGVLTLDSKPGRRFIIDKVILPDPGDLWNWTDEYTITFRSYNKPYWEDTSTKGKKDVITSAGWSAFREIGSGLLDTVADMTIRNVSGQAIESLTIAVGIWDGSAVASRKSMVEFKGIMMQGYGRLVISHTDQGYLRANMFANDNDRTGESVLINITDVSSDDLFIPAPIRGTPYFEGFHVCLYSPRACNVTYSYRGRYPN